MDALSISLLDMNTLTLVELLSKFLSQTPPTTDTGFREILHGQRKSITNPITTSRYICQTHFRSTALTVQLKLTLLPRELRNRIYGLVVGSSSPIRVCYNSSDEYLYLRLVCGTQGISWKARWDYWDSENFLEAIAGSQWASEVYHGFFRVNSFECRKSQGIPLLLESETPCKLGFLDWEGECKFAGGFDKGSWLRKLFIKIDCDESREDIPGQMRFLLSCPRLQYVDIGISGDYFRDGINAVDQRIETTAEVCKANIDSKCRLVDTGEL